MGVVTAHLRDGSISNGTVFLTSGTGFAITAEHVVLDTSGFVRVEFPGRNPLPAGLEGLRSQNDVAVLDLYTPKGFSLASGCPLSAPAQAPPPHRD